MFNYLVGYTHLKPVQYILACLKQNKIIQTITNDEENYIFKYFIEKNKPVKIALVANSAKAPLFFIEKLKLYNIKIDKILLEDIEKYKLTEYDYIVTNKEPVKSTNIVNFKERVKYPDLFVSKCVYLDREQNQINSVLVEKQPAMVKCEIPFTFIHQKGFKPIENYDSSKYIIFEKFI